LVTPVRFSGNIPGRRDDVVRLLRQEVTKASLRAELGVTIGSSTVSRQATASATASEARADPFRVSIFIADAHHPHLCPTFKGFLTVESPARGGTELILDGEYRGPLGPLSRIRGGVGSDAAALAGLKRWFDDLVHRLQRNALATAPDWLPQVPPLSLRDR
jgi:hypothetical protein